MPDFVYVLVGGLICYRVAFMITREDGPFKIFFLIRQFCDHKFGVNHWVAMGVACPLCVSFWVSLVVAWPYSNSFTNWLFGALAMAAISMIVLKFFRTV